MAEAARVYVVDDDDAARDSLAFLFQSAGYEVTTFASAPEALAGIDPGSGCVVTDVRMPGMSGVDLLRELKSRDPSQAVIVITGHGDVPLAVEAMRAGAADFLEKPFSEDAMLASVQRAAAKPVAAGADDELVERVARLSQRERQVLVRLVDGQLNKTIGHELGISMRTVEVYRANLMSKMRADSFAELVRMAIQAGVTGD